MLGFTVNINGLLFPTSFALELAFVFVFALALVFDDIDVMLLALACSNRSTTIGILGVSPSALPVAVDGGIVPNRTPVLTTRTDCLLILLVVC